MLDIDVLDWEKMDSLLPAIVQDAFDGRVLMQGYMNREALETTLTSGRVTFWSRSREALWTKGETSGHFLELVQVVADCDKDCLLVLAHPTGPVCHRNTPTCFDSEEMQAPSLQYLSELERVITQRERERPAGSYTTELLEQGVRRIAQKVGEEGVEAALAGVSGNDAELTEESADLLYHLLVLLRARGLGLAPVLDALRNRRG